MGVITIIISIVTSIIAGMVLFLMQKYLKKREQKDDEKDKANQKENVLILKSINAVGKLTVANSIALRDGKTNGEMHEAMDNYEEIDKEMYDYLLIQNSKK